MPVKVGVVPYTGEILAGNLGCLGLSAAEFGRRVGVDERTVRRWLKGEVAVPGWVPSWMAMALERADVARALGHWPAGWVPR